jgi:hypothetical protein
VVLSDLKVFPDPPPLARTNSLVCPQVREDPHGVPVNNSLPACRSSCLSICQLKHLDLRGVPLAFGCPDPLQILPERVADTLKTLGLVDSGFWDPQLIALLPTLSHCSQLTTFSFFENHISISVLRDLLHHTATLSQLSQELNPVFLEGPAGGCGHRENFPTFC